MSTDARPALPHMILLLATLVAGLSVPLQGQPAGAPSPDAVARARAALQAGRALDAARLADTVLAARPADPDAAAVKVEALLSLAVRDKALDAYDSWARAARREQLSLVGRIASAELEALSSAGTGGVDTDALRALAAHKAPTARARLEKLAWAEPPTQKSWPAIVSLAQLGDTRAATRIVQVARESKGSGGSEALRAIAVAKVGGAETVLKESLAVRDPMIQAAAAEAVAALRLQALVPDLQKVAQHGEQFAKFVAATALADLGAPGGEALLDAAASSPAADMRLKAAAARRARGARNWADQVRPLLADPDGLTRFQAAELLLEVDRPEALKVLTAGTTDSNHVIRGEVARILAADSATDAAELRRLLRDGAPRVRVSAAAALLDRSAATAAPARK